MRGGQLSRTALRGALLDGADLRGCDLRAVRLGAAELQGVTVEPIRLLDLAHLLGVRVAAVEG
ncbi:pentapeptide repeat-containing protein [Deinococcus arcticus]|uniref:Pentapeptide repeat-containing protein n=1 Tax=Deinococcus arcticus TaxID=2136176 RepID=A0A2T3WBZ5_9DEIO|nr:pentapeptide repeat-containing protein [Deinococcus arcticus]PTA69377.1 hypothetical protein C8263_03385 [Deinococcus arcticus]